MELTAENTAIVVDSTADFPDAGRALRTGASFRSTCSSAARAHDYVDLPPEWLYARPQPRRSCRRRRSRHPATSAPSTRSRRHERVYSLHLSAKFSGTWESAKLGAGEQLGTRSAPSTPSRRRRGITQLGLSIQRRLELCGRPTRRSRCCRGVQRGGGPRVHRRDARVPRPRRPHRPRAGVGRVSCSPSGRSS